MRLVRLQLEHFKAFDKFTLHLGPNAFLVGPNNAGKSTVISAIRGAANMISLARQRQTNLYLVHREIGVYAHHLVAENLGLVVENLRHQFRNQETILRLVTNIDLTLTAVWPANEEDGEEGNGEEENGDHAAALTPFFYLVNKIGLSYKRPTEMRRLGAAIGVVPGLYPINQEERVLERPYLRQHVEGRRSSQHTRNHLYLIEQDNELDAFREFAFEWLPEIVDIDINVRRSSKIGEFDLDVFVRDRGDRTSKELFWSGDGLQIFLQLLTHLWRLRHADVVVLDEPDLYLHADLQRRLVRLLQTLDAQTITATHSPEMLAEAESDSVIWIDKSRRQGIRRPSPASMQDLSAQIGSAFNLRLAAALRAKVVLFVEGDDMTILRRLARTIGAKAVGGERGCAVIPMKGFSRWVHVEPFQWLLSDFLQNSVEVFVILDRDYRTDVEIHELEAALRSARVRPHVWRRKELESYLLDVEVLARCAQIGPRDMAQLIESVTRDLVPNVRGQIVAEQLRNKETPYKADATIIQQTIDDVDRLVVDPTWRLHRSPARDVLSRVNRALQESGNLTVSVGQIAAAMKADEIPHEVVDLLFEIEGCLSP